MILKPWKVYWCVPSLANADWDKSWRQQQQEQKNQQGNEWKFMAYLTSAKVRAIDIIALAKTQGHIIVII